MSSIKQYLVEQGKDKTNPLRFYVYAYIRSKDSTTAKAGTPYYIGKGTGKRAWSDNHRCAPPDSNKIVILECNLSDVGALSLERRYIKWYGRIDNKTGILANLTDGGEGTSNLLNHPRGMKGKTHSRDYKLKLSEMMSSSGNPMYGVSRPEVSIRNKSKENIDKVSTKLKTTLRLKKAKQYGFETYNDLLVKFKEIIKTIINFEFLSQNQKLSKFNEHFPNMKLHQFLDTLTDLKLSQL